MKIAPAVTVLLFASAAALAGNVSFHHTAAPDAIVEIEVIAGSVTVSGWDKNEVAVTGTTGPDVAEVLVGGSESNVRIEVEVKDRRGRGDISADLEIRVPRGARVAVETVSAPIVVRDTTNEVSLESVSGSITIEGAPRRVEAQAVSGRIRAQTTAPIESLEAETVSGDIEIQGGLSRRAEVSAQAVSGRITLRIPAATAAEFEVSTFSGDIVNEFGHKAEASSPYVPAKELNFTIGGGGARVSLKSFSGAVLLKKL